ncbi:MAG: histidine--tRNA ligase [Candidatus Gracilibacteria bacterium]|jgi:histidyl-tRNA synthetase
MKKIEPIILKGTRDFLPQEMSKRLYVMDKIRRIFEKFGYDTIETPIICPAETILGKYGDEGTKLTYNFNDNGNRRIALPYDLTVPFARLVAANWRNLPMPFKRYQIQRVWRAENPQKGRLREFYQCDIDIIGTTSLIAETETAKIIAEVFNALGFKNINIKINSRRLLNAVLKAFSIPEEKIIGVIRQIDKLDKIGEENVILGIKDLGINEGKEILNLLKPEKTNTETFKKLAKYDLSELIEFFKYCKEFDIPDEMIKFDPSLARGLDYYTGITYEVVSKDLDFGSLCAGGRYDNLCGLFCDENFSGVGVAFGFERIMMGMDKLNLLPELGTNSKVMVTIFDENCIPESFKIYNRLLEDGINSEIYLEPGNLSKQFKYADKKRIPFVVILGPDEIKEGKVMIKSMTTGKQKDIPIEQLTKYFNGYLTN